MDGLIVGFGLGFLIALQLGPMSLLLIRSTLRSGISVGLAIGAGIAVVDALYAAAGAAGAAALVQVRPIRVVLGLVGAAVLVWLGLRALYVGSRRGGDDTGATAPANPRRAFMTALVATASNPTTIVSWAAVFTAASVTTDAGAASLVIGVALGSATWVTALACIVAVVRRGATPALVLVVDVVAGCGLLAFGAVLSYRALGT